MPKHTIHLIKALILSFLDPGQGCGIIMEAPWPLLKNYYTSSFETFKFINNKYIHYNIGCQCGNHNSHHHQKSSLHCLSHRHKNHLRSNLDYYLNNLFGLKKRYSITSLLLTLIFFVMSAHNYDFLY